MVHPFPLRDRDLLADLRVRARVPSSTTPTLQVVTLLLAALEVGQNIDRLARYTGIERSFVARCARRLIDNGVWSNGETICDWLGEGVAHSGFWNDVAVAEGKLCRRINEQGVIEWAVPGYWRKNYDFVTPEPVDELTVRYHVPGEEDVPETSEVGWEREIWLEDAAPPAPKETPPPALAPDASSPQKAVRRSPGRRRKQPTRRPRTPRIPLRYSPDDGGAVGEAARVPTPVLDRVDLQPAVPDLFPGAVWIG